MPNARKGNRSGPEGGRRGGTAASMQAATRDHAQSRSKVSNIRKEPGERGRRRRRFAGT